VKTVKSGLASWKVLSGYFGERRKSRSDLRV
jgi:hypothetical protein